MKTLSFTVDQLGRLHHLATSGNRRSAKRYLRDFGFDGNGPALTLALGMIEQHPERKRIESISQRWHDAIRASRHMLPGFEPGLRELAIEYARTAVLSWPERDARRFLLLLFQTEMPYDITSYFDRNPDRYAPDVARATLRWACPVFDHAEGAIDLEKVRGLLADQRLARRGDRTVHDAIQLEVDKAWALGAMFSAINGPLLNQVRHGADWTVKMIGVGGKPGLRTVAFPERGDAEDFALLVKALYGPEAHVELVLRPGGQRDLETPAQSAT